MRLLVETIPNETRYQPGARDLEQLLGAIFLACFLWLDTSWATLTTEYHSLVVDVIDGDTIVISNKVSRGVKVRAEGPIKLDAIDAPELDQPCGREARAFLEELIKGKEISVRELTDMGKSRGAWIFISEEGKKKNVNLLMVQTGLARCAKLYVHSMASVPMQKAQDEAIRLKLGIWATDNSIPPLEWKSQKQEDTLQQPAEAVGQPEPKPKLTISNTVETFGVRTREPMKQSDTQNPLGSESDPSKKKVNALTILLSSVAAILAICIATRLIKKRP